MLLWTAGHLPSQLQWILPCTNKIFTIDLCTQTWWCLQKAYPQTTSLAANPRRFGLLGQLHACTSDLHCWQHGMLSHQSLSHTSKEQEPQEFACLQLKAWQYTSPIKRFVALIPKICASRVLWVVRWQEGGYRAISVPLRQPQRLLIAGCTPQGLPCLSLCWSRCCLQFSPSLRNFPKGK